MSRRLRHEDGLAMTMDALLRFVTLFYSRSRPPSVADIVRIVQHHPGRFQLDSRGHISMSSERLFRQRPSQEDEPLLSHRDVTRIVNAMDIILLKAHCRCLHHTVLYFILREAFSVSPRPPNWAEFFMMLADNQDKFARDGDGYIHLEDVYAHTLMTSFHPERYATS